MICNAGESFFFFFFNSDICGFEQLGVAISEVP